MKDRKFKISPEQIAAAGERVLKQMHEEGLLPVVSSISPAAPVPAQPSDAQVQQDEFADRIWSRMRKSALSDNLIKPMNIHTVRALVDAFWAEIRCAMGKTTGSEEERHHSKCGIYNFAGNGKCTCGYDDRLPKGERDER